MGKGSRLVVIALILAGGGAAGHWTARTRAELRRSATRLEHLEARRHLLGRPFKLGSALQAQGGLTFPSADTPTTLVLLIVGADNCLRCLVEIERWRALGAPRGSVEVASVMVGAPQSLTERIGREERLPFPVLADPESTVPRDLGLTFDGTLRLIVVDGRIALIADGPDDGPVGFPEAVLALMKAPRAKSN